VAPFELDASPGRDLALLRNGPVVLFRRPEVLDGTSAWLAEHGYRVVRLDARDWAGAADLHREIGAALGFPDHYGHNLDAFDECMTEVAAYGHGADRDATGTVLVLVRYDAFAAREPRVAQGVLDVVGSAARFAMLFGHRMLCLVQTDDPDLRFAPVGATPVAWNPDEATRAGRR
jgi:hypothetical protein